MARSIFLHQRKLWRFKKLWARISQWFLMNVPTPIPMTVIFENRLTELSSGQSNLKKPIQEKIKWFLVSYKEGHLKSLGKKAPVKLPPYPSTGAIGGLS